MLLVLVGAGLLRVSLFSDEAQRYVKPSLQPYLIVSGVFLVLLGALGAHREGVFRRRRAPDRGGAHGRGRGAVAAPPHADGGHGHDHGRVPRVAWLLLPPALLLMFFAPPALGSYSAAHDNPLLVAPYGHFPALPAADPVPLSLTEYIGRLQQDRAHRSLVGRTVLLEGFATPEGHGGWKLSRLIVWCCAADAQSLSVTVHGAKAPPADAWVQVTGTWHRYGTFGTASAAVALDATSVRRVPEPARPYQDTAPKPPAVLPQGALPSPAASARAVTPSRSAAPPRPGRGSGGSPASPSTG